ncbi:MAG: 30S ribosome-binding factor RbfA [Elusimicrobiaceae bacterium]|nr:30S ribosome-binding factor RbfA [Elusimicrobiaceae bacterium]MBR3899655.1 30S ribosome-binding factor RbfA [Elusimicrobiaceae bacterium]
MIDRTKRLETLFLQEINTHITKMTAAGSLGGFVTITAVHVAKDLATAKVYFSVFGSPEDKKKTQEQLSLLRKEIGALLRHRLHLKRIPSFSFEYDNTPEQASRVESIFKVIEKEKEQDKKDE